MSKRQATDQGRHLAALRDRARRPDTKDRSGRGLAERAAIEAELDPDPYLSAALAEAEWDEEGDE